MEEGGFSRLRLSPDAVQECWGTSIPQDVLDYSGDWRWGQTEEMCPHAWRSFREQPQKPAG